MPHINFAFWGLVTAAIAYCVPDWHHMQLIFSVPMLAAEYMSPMGATTFKSIKQDTMLFLESVQDEGWPPLREIYKGLVVQ